MKVAVLGGAGLIGNAVVRALIAAGQLVRHGILTHPELPLPRIASVQTDPEAQPEKPEPVTEPKRSHPPKQWKPAVLITTWQDRVLLPDFRGLSIDEVRQATRGRLWLYLW